MKNRILKSAALILVGLMMIVALAGACATSATTPQTPESPAQTLEPIKLRMGSSVPSISIIALVEQKWIEKIESETNGRVQITYYPAGTLVNQVAAWDELLAGVADIATVIPDITPTFPITAAVDTFTYGTDLPGARQILNKLLKESPEMQAEYAGIKRLSGLGAPGQYALSKKPIRTLDDFKGLQFMPSPSYPGLLDKLGATGNFLPMTEVYPALEKGIIDGAFGTPDSLKSMNYAEVTNYSTNVHLQAAPGAFYGMNLDTWTSLPADIQKVFEDSLPWMESELDKATLKENQECIDFAKAKGHEFIELSAEDLNKLYSIIEGISLEKAANLDAKGLPGTEIFRETRRLVEEYVK